MFFMTTRLDKKKLLLILAGIAVIIAAAVLLFGGDGDAQPTAASSLSTNDGRVKFLTDFGWEVASSPEQTGQVRIPQETTEVFERYNALQKSQGYDLSKYVGKTVMRYVYKIKNYPGATEPVYATLLVYKDQIIGGDVTDTAAKGVIRGFKKPADPVTPPTAPQETQSVPETLPSE